ncbi:MAG: hypothetical protein JXR96_02060 [Deltaproteobacteria bacterium]|nr:hypothetical protein [Deltaproteobacteria bacterium]
MEARAGKTESIVLTGMVVPVAWDDDDQVTSVSIMDEEGNEYIVEEGKMSGELLDHVDEDVEVNGEAWEDEYGDKMLRVSDYRVVSSDEDDEDLEDEDFEEEEYEEEEYEEEEYEEDEDDEDE